MWHSSASAQGQNAWKACYKSCENLTMRAIALHEFPPDFCLVVVNQLTVELQEIRRDQNATKDKEKKKTPHSFHEISHASLSGEIPDKVIPKSIRRYLRKLLSFQTSWAYVMQLSACAKKRNLLSSSGATVLPMQVQKEVPKYRKN